MNTSRRSLRIATALATMMVFAAPVSAQDPNAMPPEVARDAAQNQEAILGAKDQFKHKRERGTRPTSMREQRKARMEALKKSSETDEAPQEVEKSPVMYPQASRVEPEATATRSGVKRLQALIETYGAGNAAATIAAAGEIAADAEANAYEKAFALQIAGNAASSQGDDAAAADYFAKAIESGGLSNNDHYTAMFNLAVVQFGLERYDAATPTIDRFLAETKSAKPEALNLRAGIMMAQERYAEAAEIYTAQLAANPDDKTARMNAVAAYQQIEQFDKAVELLAGAHAKGQFTAPDEYRALYVSYLNSKRDKDALALIDDGLAKGILKPTPELARAYMVIGQNAYYDKDDATALEMYKRAAPIAADGEAALNLAKVYSEAGNKAEAIAAAKLALEKGVKDTEVARRLAGGK